MNKPNTKEINDSIYYLEQYVAIQKIAHTKFFNIEPLIKQKNKT